MKSRLESVDKAFGRRLQKLRQERNWTQAELATKAGVDRSVIGNYEQGVSFPPVPVLRKMALALAVSVDQLIFEDLSPTQRVHDQMLLDLFAKVDKLDYRAKDIIKEVVEGMLAKRERETSQHHRAA